MSNEADLSRSSTPSLAHRRCDPRSLEPLVRSLRFNTTGAHMTDPGILRPRILKRTSETKLRRHPPDQNTCGHFVHNVGTAELAMPSSSPGKPVRPNLGSSRPSGKVRGPSPMWPLRRQEERSLNRAARLVTASNDEVERRGVAPASIEADLSKSSTSLLGSAKLRPAIARTDC